MQIPAGARRRLFDSPDGLWSIRRAAFKERWGYHQPRVGVINALVIRNQVYRLSFLTGKPGLAEIFGQSTAMEECTYEAWRDRLRLLF